MGYFPGETLAQPYRAIFDQSALRNRTPDSNIPSNQDDQLSDLHQIRAMDRKRKGLFADMASEISFWVLVVRGPLRGTASCVSAATGRNRS